MSLITNLSVYYECGESSAGSAPVTRVDANGSGANLTDTNNTPSITIGGKLYADFTHASAQQLSVADTPAVNPGTASFTLAFWFKLHSSPGTIGLVSKGYPALGGASAGGFGLYYDGSSIKYQVGNGSGAAVVTVPAAPFADTGLHCCIVYLDVTNNLLAYSFDGSTFTTSAYSGGNTSNSRAFRIGELDTNGNQASASIGYVGLWKGRVFSDGDATQFYNSGVPLLYTELNPSLTIDPPVISYTDDVGIHGTRANATGGSSPYTYDIEYATDPTASWTSTGQTGTTWAKTSSLLAATIYWWRTKVVDNVSAVVYSQPTAAILTGKVLSVRTSGDSKWASPDSIAGGTNAGPQALADEIAASLGPRKCTLGGNSCVAGAVSADWRSDAAGSPNYTVGMVTAANSNGDNLFGHYVGSNDSTQTGGTPVTAATFKANVQSYCDYVLANATAPGGPIILLVKPTFYWLDPLIYDNTHIKALLSYAAKLDELAVTYRAAGKMVYAVGEYTAYQICQTPSLMQTADVHETNPAGQTLSGKNAARDFAGQLRFAGGVGTNIVILSNRRVMR